MSGSTTADRPGPDDPDDPGGSDPSPDPVLERWLQAMQPSEAEGGGHDSWAQLSHTLEDERGLRAWLRSRPTSVRLAVAVSVAVLLPALVLLLTPRVDLDVLPARRFAIDLVLLSVPAALAMAIALHPIHKPALPRWLTVTGVVLAIGGVTALCLLPQAHVDHPASLLGVGEDLVPRAVGCFSFGSVLALPMLLVLRGLARGRGGWLLPTMAAAATVVLVGSVALYLHCPLTAPLHLWAGHATVWLPFLALALFRAYQPPTPASRRGRGRGRGRGRET